MANPTPTDWRVLCAEQLPELRGMFERILFTACSSGGPTVGHILLADRLIDAVVSWSDAALAQPDPGAPTDEELVELFNENDWNFIGPETFIDIARSVLELQ